MKTKNNNNEAQLVEIGKEVNILKEKNHELEDEIKNLNAKQSEEIKTKNEDAALVVFRKELITLKEKNYQYQEEIENLKEEYTTQSTEMTTIVSIYLQNRIMKKSLHL